MYRHIYIYIERERDLNEQKNIYVYIYICFNVTGAPELGVLLLRHAPLGPVYYNYCVLLVLSMCLL